MGKKICYEDGAENNKALRRGIVSADLGDTCLRAAGLQSRSLFHSLRPEPNCPSVYAFDAYISRSPDLRVRAASHAGQGLGRAQTTEAGIEIQDAGAGVVDLAHTDSRDLLVSLCIRAREPERREMVQCASRSDFQRSRGHDGRVATRP